VDRASFDELRRGAEVIEPGTDFFGGFVGEGERVNARGRDAHPLDQEPDPFDQAERFSSSGTREDQGRTESGLDSFALRRRGTQ